MARVKLSSRVTLPASVKEAQKVYLGTRKGYSKAGAQEIYDRLIAKDSSPEGVKKAKSAYRTARRGLLRNAYFGKLAERTKSMRNDFKIHKLLGVIFTVIPFRLGYDYLKSRKALRSKLDLIGHVLSIELARDPSLRKAVKTLAEHYPYLSVNKKGEIYLSSFSGSIFDKSTAIGKMVDPDYANYSRQEIHKYNKISGQKLNLKLLLSIGNPKFEKAIGTSTIAGSPATAPINVTAALMGNNEIRIFARTVSGGVTNSEERTITSAQVKSKKLINSPVSGQKILLVEVEEPGKPIELVRLELEAKKAESIFKGFNIKK